MTMCNSRDDLQVIDLDVIDLPQPAFTHNPLTVPPNDTSCDDKFTRSADLNLVVFEAETNNPMEIKGDEYMEVNSLPFMLWLKQSWHIIFVCQSVIVKYSVLCTVLVLMWTIPMILFGVVPYHIAWRGNEVTELSLQEQIQYVSVVRYPSSTWPLIFPWMIRTCLAWHIEEDELSKKKKRIWNVIEVYLVLQDMVISTLAIYNIGSRLIGRGIGVLNFVFQFMYLYYPTRNNPGAKWYHNLLCGGAMTVEIVFSVLVVDYEGFIQSEMFQYIAPFLLSLTAMLSRKAAEVSTYSMHTAAIVSTASLGFNQLFIRAAHVASQKDPTRMILLELFYGCTSLITKSTLYYRHVLINKWSSGKCTFRVGNSERARYITAHSNVADAIFEMVCFAGCWISRQVMDPIPYEQFVWIFVVCFLLQYMMNALSLMLTGYMERIDLDKVVPKFFENRDEFKLHLFYFGSTLVCGFVYMLHVLVTLWDHSARKEFLGK
eukprot:PhF_6_TR5653/c0_g1_i8/m.8280